MQKVCKKCKVTLPIGAFYPHKEMVDGYLNTCKECHKRAAAARREAKLEEIRAYDRKRGGGRGPSSPEARARAYKAWALRIPHKVSASTAVHNAVRDGRLTKGPCEVCGEKIVQGHHDDYTKPLEVRWLCDYHHKQHHNQVRELQRAS